MKYRIRQTLTIVVEADDADGAIEKSYDTSYEDWWNDPPMAVEVKEEEN